jgi:hypothetical protein
MIVLTISGVNKKMNANRDPSREIETSAAYLLNQPLTQFSCPIQGCLANQNTLDFS